MIWKNTCIIYTILSFFLLKYIPNLEMIGKAILALYIYNLTKRGNVQSILPLIEKISTYLLMFFTFFSIFSILNIRRTYFFLQTVHWHLIIKTNWCKNILNFPSSDLVRNTIVTAPFDHITSGSPKCLGKVQQ